MQHKQGRVLHLDTVYRSREMIMMVQRAIRSSALFVAMCAASTSAVRAADYPPSTCYGDTDNGAVEGAVQFPEEGTNFERYRWKQGAKRVYLHSAVVKILEDAYLQLEKTAPDTRWVIGETGLESGGPFPPHKTHQNGTSADLMVPVKDVRDGSRIPFPNDFRNGYGYKVSFDSQGLSTDGKLQIDFDALAEYIHQLADAAKRQGYGLVRVILAVDLQWKLTATDRGTGIRWKVRLIGDPERHDNHIHVDFDIPCKSMRDYKKP